MSRTEDTLKIDSIQRDLNTKCVGHRIIFLDSATSTNDIAWSHAAAPESEGLCILAEQQTAGRGRRGRRWYSTPGQSILCSILIRNTQATTALLTLAAPVAVIDAVSACCDLDAVIKWPNDILIKGKKIVGILVESRKIGPQTISVIGIGINVHQTKEDFVDLELDTPASSLDIESRRTIDRNELLRHLFSRLEKRVRMAAEKPEKLLHDWKLRNQQIGSRIELESDGRQYAGTCIGIDPIEGLLVQIDRGPVKIFSAAHTSIVKNSR